MSIAKKNAFDPHAKNEMNGKENGDKSPTKFNYLDFKTELKLCYCVAGIYFFYMLYGFFQEEIVTQEFGPKKEKFKFTLFLIFIQCIVNAICAYAMLLYQKDNSKVPITQYFFYFGYLYKCNVF